MTGTSAGPGRYIAVGEQIRRTLRYTREEIADFARLTLDSNPLHRDTQAAQRSRFGEVIASGQHTAAKMMGLLASHFSRDDDGLKREMLCLNFNFAFKHPVFAEQDVAIIWTVATVDWHALLKGWLGHVDGVARAPGGHAAVIGRGTILVKQAAG